MSMGGRGCSLLGCIVFGLASVACALAPSVTLLIAARVVQGIAAAIVTPASLALIGAVYPREERNQRDRRVGRRLGVDDRGRPDPGRLADGDISAGRWCSGSIRRLRSSPSRCCSAFAPEDRRETRPFDMIGAAILAVSLGVLAWALSQIGPAEPAGERRAPACSRSPSRSWPRWAALRPMPSGSAKATTR